MCKKITQVYVINNRESGTKAHVMWNYHKIGQINVYLSIKKYAFIQLFLYLQSTCTLLFY